MQALFGFLFLGVPGIRYLTQKQAFAEPSNREKG